MNVEPFEYMCSEEGQREIQQWILQRDKEWHAHRFQRSADRHDTRIPWATRVTALERANDHCERCNRFISSYSASRCLELHHLNYERVGSELPEDLKALCRECHGKTHGLI
jgi:hypothetical protein